MLAKTRNFVRNLNFGKKKTKLCKGLICWPKLENLRRNKKFGKKSKYWPKIEILANKSNV